MGIEIDLLAAYPRPARDVTGRGNTKTDEDRAIARRFDVAFFDGDRRHGYGGFSYHPRFWQPVVPAFREHFSLVAGDHVLDVGCAKGFMLHDMAEAIPGLVAHGIDISSYAVENAIEDMRGKLKVADATSLPYDDESMDVVISINTIHNLERTECAQALREITRVARRGSFVTVDAYRTDAERDRMDAWNLTAKTIMHVDEWKAFFHEVGYEGDYYWFLP